MGIKLSQTGSIYNASVKDKILRISFGDVFEVKTELPFVKEDFEINNNWSVSNIALLLTAQSGNLLVGWFTGGISILEPVGGNYRAISMNGFNIPTFIDETFDIIHAGVAKGRLRYYVTKSDLYPIISYIPKDSSIRDYMIIEPQDLGNPIIVRISQNTEMVGELIHGNESYPGYRRIGETLSNGEQTKSFTPICTIYQKDWDRCSIDV